MSQLFHKKTSEQMMFGGFFMHWNQFFNSVLFFSVHGFDKIHLFRVEWSFILTINVVKPKFWFFQLGRWFIPGKNGVGFPVNKSPVDGTYLILFKQRQDIRYNDRRLKMTAKLSGTPPNNPEGEFTNGEACSTNRNGSQKLVMPAKLSGKPLNNPEGKFANSGACKTNRNGSQKLEMPAKLSGKLRNNPEE